MEANIEKGTKICSRCKQEKPLTDFYASVNAKESALNCLVKRHSRELKSVDIIQS